jgi:multiple sugar transport system permease protein
MKENNKINPLTTGLMLLAGFIFILPIILMVLGSLKTIGEINAASYKIFPRVPQLSNYVDAFTKGMWPRWLFNSLYITFMATAISLLLNLMAGYAFARLSFPGKGIMFTLALIGLLMPPEVTLAPMYIMMAKFPLIGGNNILGQGGIGFIDTYSGLIIPFIAGSFGVFLARQYYLGFPTSLDDSSNIDGCTRFQTFWMIYLPLSKPLIASLGIIKATFTWNQYAWPLVITNSPKMRTVQLALDMFKGEDYVEWNLLLAATTLVALHLLLMFLKWQDAFIQVNASSGTKG